MTLMQDLADMGHESRMRAEIAKKAAEEAKVRAKIQIAEEQKLREEDQKQGRI